MAKALLLALSAAVLAGCASAPPVYHFGGNRGGLQAPARASGQPGIGREAWKPGAAPGGGGAAGNYAPHEVAAFVGVFRDSGGLLEESRSQSLQYTYRFSPAWGLGAEYARYSSALPGYGESSLSAGSLTLKYFLSPGPGLSPVLTAGYGLFSEKNGFYGYGTTADGTGSAGFADLALRYDFPTMFISAGARYTQFAAKQDRWNISGAGGAFNFMSYSLSAGVAFSGVFSR